MRFGEWARRLDERVMGPPPEHHLEELSRGASEPRLGYLWRLYVYAARHSTGPYGYDLRLFVFGHFVLFGLVGLASAALFGATAHVGIGMLVGLLTGAAMRVWGWRSVRRRG
jgi:hypothetical protein